MKAYIKGKRANLKTGVLRKQSTPNFPENEYFLPSGGKKCLFFGKFGVFCFLETPVLRFALLPYYRRMEKILFLRCRPKCAHPARL